MPKALITGICGQDGAYLSQHLRREGYEVYGIARRNAPLDRLEKLGTTPTVVHADICDPQHVRDVIEGVRPDEIYNLAAQSHVGLSFNNPMQTCQVNYGGYLNVLLAARKVNRKIKVYQAGTSEMFGYAAESVCNERTPFMPMSPYAISKVAAHWAGVNARYEADQFVANGILFNHESPLRGGDFVTQKICRWVRRFKEGQEQTPLQLGNLSSRRDWGHARDYVEAMHLMLQHDAPDDFVVATGVSLSVRKFAELAFKSAGFEIKFDGAGREERGMVGGQCVIQVNAGYYRPNDLTHLKGDATKARQVLKWAPKTSIEQMVEEMVNE